MVPSGEPRDTRFDLPWLDKNDQCAFVVTLAYQVQDVDLDLPWHMKDDQYPFGMALASPHACSRKGATSLGTCREKRRGGSGRYSKKPTIPRPLRGLPKSIPRTPKLPTCYRTRPISQVASFQLPSFRTTLRYHVAHAAARVCSVGGWWWLLRPAIIAPVVAGSVEDPIRMHFNRLPVTLFGVLIFTFAHRLLIIQGFCNQTIHAYNCI